MVTPVEKRDPSKYCEFHSDTGHNTNECMQLRKQIDEMIKAGKLSQFIKELKQNDKPKAPKKGEASGKDKPLTILMIQPWERVAKPRITQSFSPETAMSFPPLSEEDGTESPMIVEVEMGGHFMHRVYIDGGASSEVLETKLPLGHISLASKKIGDEVTLPSRLDEHHEMVNQNVYRVDRVRDAVPMECSILRNLPPASPQDIHQSGKRREDRHRKEISNPRRGGGGEGRSGPGISEGDFKDLNNACPKDCYPLPEIDWKVESLCGYSFKCFLDAYKGYHQIKMAKEDEEKTAFIKKQGYFSYPIKHEIEPKEMHLRNAGRNVLRTCKAKWKISKLNKVSLNRFLSKSAKKSLPFFKTLKKFTKKSDFQWTPEAEEAFKQMKKLIADLPTLTAPREHEELIIYLAAAKEAISVVLMTDREGRQIPVYFVSRTLRGPKVNYTPMEKLVLALLSASKWLKRYFQAHTVIVITNQPIKQLLSSSEISGRMLK
ncbi:reverse transcriptase domain-containing protein [Tanacetum coccineum]